jgi:neutral ceramidase
VPSVGVHDAPRAHALAIEAGAERIVILPLDATLVIESSLFALEAAVAPDGSMRGRILLAGSHSHAAWAGWQPSLPLMPGIDRPRKDLSDRMIEAMAQAARDALDALEPARLGVGVDALFDPDDTVSRDRRGDNDTVIGPDGNTAGMGKDPVAWAIRVDRADGTPLAAIVNLAFHGTVGEEHNPLASTDVTGALTRSLAAELGYPVLHLQGATGDISPAGIGGRSACPDATRCLDIPRLEAIGARAAPLIAPLVRDIETGDRAAIEMVTRTFYSGREAEVVRPDGTVLRYAPADPELEPDGVIFDDSGKIVSPIDEFNTAAGAGLCGTLEGGSLAPIPGAFGLGAYSSCLDLDRGKDLVFGLFDVPSDVPVPLCDTVRTTTSAVRIAGTPSGDWLILGLPGEPTAPFASYLRSRSPAGPERTLLVGYAQDHAGYLLTAEDWLAGGYEPSTNLWGPLEGEIILAGIVEAANIAWTPEHEDPEVNSSRFVEWAFPPVDPIEALITTDHGTVAAASASPWWPDTAGPAAPTPEVARAVGAARFVWNGGDPAVDLPEVTIEREAAPDVFEPLRDERGNPASSRDGVVVLTYVPEPLEAAAPTRHVYGAVWQPVPPDPFRFDAPDRPFALPLGRYRFRVRGDAQATPGKVGYELVSDPFTVVAAPLAPESTAVSQGAAILITALLANAPGLRALREGTSDVGVPLRGPWTVEVTFGAAPAVILAVTPDGSGAGLLPLTAAEIADVVSIDVRDPAGNGGPLALR